MLLNTRCSILQIAILDTSILQPNIALLGGGESSRPCPWPDKATEIGDATLKISIRAG